LDKKLAVSGNAIETLQIDALVNSNAIPGNYLLSFDSSSAVAATNETSNALLGTTPATFTVTIQPTATLQPTLVPTQAPGNPNSCGGTCGSNSNCQTNYVCFNGYCRNPYCTSVTDCNCASVTPPPTPTAIPTNIPAKTTRPKITSAPTAMATLKKTPKETALETQAPSNFWESVYSSPSVAPISLPTLLPGSALPKSNTVSLLPWIIGSLVAGGIALLLIAMRFYKQYLSKKSKPPVIKI
jgi:hypothetical protein